MDPYNQVRKLLTSFTSPTSLRMSGPRGSGSVGTRSSLSMAATLELASVVSMVVMSTLVLGNDSRKSPMLARGGGTTAGFSTGLRSVVAAT